MEKLEMIPLEQKYKHSNRLFHADRSREADASSCFYEINKRINQQFLPYTVMH